jgi:hypothetical protein
LNRLAAITRAVIAALSTLAAGVVLHACVIEERSFDEQLSSCAEYCQEVTRKCSDEFTVYGSEAQCQAVCAQIPLGSEDDPPGQNTLLCRLDRLHAGSFERNTDCAAVGPGGAGICGNDCDSFCALRRTACSTLQPNQIDINRENFCETNCPGLATQPSYSIVTDGTSDTLQCRLIQVARALETPALSSCAQSQIVPELGNVCRDAIDSDFDTDCSVYCHLVQTSCTDSNAVYENEEQCNAACATFERGEVNDTATNTLRCRRYHAYAAMDIPEEHCPHAGPTGDGHCATREQKDMGNCVSFCRIASNSCPDEYTAHYDRDNRRPNPPATLALADVASCLADCETLSDSGYNGFAGLDEAGDVVLGPAYTTEQAPEGNTLQCRTYHAVRAPFSDNPQAECAAAFGELGSACQ